MAALAPSVRRDRIGSNSWLAEMLCSPIVSVAAQELPQYWKCTNIVFICEMPKGFEPGAWMPRSVRGALGRILGQWRDEGRPNGFPASAFEGLFQTQGVLDNVHIPKPILVQVSSVGREIRISISLYGKAGMWRDDVIEAMGEALSGGIGLKENGRILRPWPVLDWHWLQECQVIIPEYTGKALLRFNTPFKPGSDEAFSGDLVTALGSLSVRLRGLARWNALDVCLDQGALRAASDFVHLREVRPGSGFDGFIRHDKTGDVPIVGINGAWELSKISKAIWPILFLGQRTAIGGHRAYGFGVYDCFAVE